MSVISSHRRRVCWMCSGMSCPVVVHAITSQPSASGGRGSSVANNSTSDNRYVVFPGSCCTGWTLFGTEIYECTSCSSWWLLAINCSMPTTPKADDPGTDGAWTHSLSTINENHPRCSPDKNQRIFQCFGSRTGSGSRGIIKNVKSTQNNFTFYIIISFNWLLLMKKTLKWYNYAIILYHFQGLLDPDF